jgi:hypothetical protein
MEARQTLRGSAVPKGLTVVIAMFAAVGLAVGAAVVSNELKGSSASQSTSVHAAPGTVLRQDAQAAPALIDRAAPGTVLRQDAQAAQAAPALIDRGAEGQAASQAAPVLARGARSGGNQSVIDNGWPEAADTHGPDSDLTRALPSQTISGTGGEPTVGLTHGNRYI